MKLCLNCKVEIEDENAYCPQCGCDNKNTPILNEPNQQTNILEKQAIITPASDTPILEHEVKLRKKKIDFGTPAVARLYAGKIEITDKSGMVILTAQTLSLRDVRDLRGVLSFIHNDQFYSLGFVAAVSMMLGVVGVLVDGGIKRSRAWREALQAQGVQVEKRWI